MPITSLHYFGGLVDEVAATAVADSYWLHVQRKAEQLERRWIASRTGNLPVPEDEIMLNLPRTWICLDSTSGARLQSNCTWGIFNRR